MNLTLSAQQILSLYKLLYRNNCESECKQSDSESCNLQEIYYLIESYLIDKLTNKEQFDKFLLQENTRISNMLKIDETKETT